MRVLLAAHRLLLLVLGPLLAGGLLLLLLLLVGMAAPTTTTAAAVAVRVENYATASDQPGATALVPEPGKLYLRMEGRHPYLAPLPGDRGQGDAKWPFCAWQVATEPSASSFGLLDLNAVYHTLVVWEFKDTDVYRVRGQFPAVRYFSLQSYEFTNGKPIASMLDRHVVPASGRNPHADPTAAPGERGTFEVYLTASGAHGYPNELRVKWDGQMSNVVAVIYRMYDADPSVAGCGNWTRKQQFWGSADPAIVERLALRDDGDAWEEVPPCTDFGAALFQSTFTDLYPVFRKFPATPASCPMATLSEELFPSMILFGAGLEKGYAASITSYTNFDTRYLYWCAQKAQVGPNLVIRMQGVLPRVPRSLYEHPRVAEAGQYDARYISISTIDMLYPSPTYQEFEDHDIERFYSQVPNWDRTYSIVFAVEPSIARACSLYDQDSQMFLGWKDAYHYGLEPTRMPSIVYRELLPTEAADGGRGHSLLDVKRECTARAGGGPPDACADGNVLHEIMGDMYPRIDVWSCDPETGVATLLA